MDGSGSLQIRPWRVHDGRRDRARTVAVDKTAARLFAGVLAFQLILTAVQLFALPRTGGVVLGEALGGLILGVLIAAWVAAAALGNPRVGPWKSARIMAPHLPWSAGLSLAVVMPLMVSHYALGALAMMEPQPLLWPVLIADTLLVGLLAAVMGASGYLIARRGADRAGVLLIGSATEMLHAPIITAVEPVLPRISFVCNAVQVREKGELARPHHLQGSDSGAQSARRFARPSRAMSS